MYRWQTDSAKRVTYIWTDEPGVGRVGVGWVVGWGRGEGGGWGFGVASDKNHWYQAAYKSGRGGIR